MRVSEEAETCRITAMTKENIMQPDNPEPSRPLEERFAELARKTTLLEAMTTAHMEAVRLAPAIETARENAVLVRYAELATRTRANEEQHHELVSVVVEMFDMVKEMYDEFKGGN